MAGARPIAAALRKADIRRRLSGDTGIVTGAFVVINILKIVSSMTLTRLLSPEVFGVIGLLMSLSYILAMLSDLGFQAFIIKHKDGGDKDLRNAVWTIRLVRSGVLTVAMIGLAYPLAFALGKPELTLAIQVCGATFLLEGLSSLSLLTSLRDGQLRRLTVTELATQIAQLIAAILFAIWVRSYWAIIYGIVVYHLLRVVASYWFFPDSGQRFRFDRRLANEMFHFAKFVTGSSIVTLIISQVDKVLFSRIFPLDYFGLYILAFNLTNIPVTFAASYVNQVLYPRYAAAWLAEPLSFPAVYYKAKRNIEWLYVFATGGLVGCAPLVVEVLYDDRYRGAALFVRILGISTMFSLATLAARNAMTACDRIQHTFRSNVLRLAWLAVAGPVGWLLWGPIGLVLVYGTIEVAALLYQWWVLRSFGIFSVRQELIPLLIGAAGIAIGMAGTLLLLPIVHALA